MIKAKNEIAGTAPAHHGAFDYGELARLGLSPDDVLDFSVNSNPYGPPSCVYEALARVPLSRYPDPECLALRNKLADYHGVSADHIVVGNGTAELLLLIAFAFLERGMTVLVPDVTFSEYERVARIVGATVQTLPLTLDSVAGAHLVFLCNPNNPDGTFLPPEQLIEQWIAPNPNTLFIVDEAYANFLQAPQTLIGTNAHNVLVVRSMTKDYALAGLRLGYVVGQPDQIEAIRRVRPAWNVNAPAQAVGLAVLDERDWLHKTVKLLHDNKRVLFAHLSAMGFGPHPSSVHYFLMKVDNSSGFRAQLLKHNVMVRDCASFGLPDYVRIATRTPEDNKKLLDALKLNTSPRRNA